MTRLFGHAVRSLLTFRARVSFNSWSDLAPPRRPRPDFPPRPMSLTFEHHTTITLGDTDHTQAVYFAHFFQLQGVVRELWVLRAVANSERHLREGLVLITRSASCDYHRKLKLFDPVVCRMWIRNLRQASADLVFHFYHADTGALHVEGWQRVAFADAEGRLRRMPDDFRRAALAYLAPEPDAPAALAEPACA
jgi:acyl-CoA thioesterase FadM